MRRRGEGRERGGRDGVRGRAAKARDGQVARVALRLSVGEDGKERKAETRIVCVGEGHHHLEGAGAGHVHHDA